MRSWTRLALLAALASSSLALAAQTPKPATPAAQPGLIAPAEAARILPPSVFFRGLSAPAQSRNSGGVRFPDQRLFLVTLVDTSGYSSQVQEKYQAYLLTETAIEIDGHRLPPGAYGCGFIADNVFIVQDIGAHDLFTAHSTRDASLHRPTPLQVTLDEGKDGNYRLYGGRSYITFHAAGDR
jgi:hypothetical protein